MYSLLGKWMLQECFSCFSSPSCRHICLYFQLSEVLNLLLGCSFFFAGEVHTKFLVAEGEGSHRDDPEEHWGSQRGKACGWGWERLQLAWWDKTSTTDPAGNNGIQQRMKVSRTSRASHLARRWTQGQLSKEQWRVNSPAGARHLENTLKFITPQLLHWV